MAGRPWTQKDEATLSQSYKRKAIADLASHLSRTVAAIHQKANALGLNEKRDKAEIENRKAKIRKLIAQGLSDSEVAGRLKMKRRALSEMRCRMGVLANGRNERYRRRVAKKTKAQCKAAGVSSLAEVRAKRFDEFVADLGWPGLSVRAAQIAESLYRLGPMTRKQICKAIGMPWKGTKKSLSAAYRPGGSYMAELQRAGIVVRLRAAITHKGSGRSEDLYMIGLDVEPCKKT